MAEIVDIGDLRLRHRDRFVGASSGSCSHKHLELDSQGHVVRCVDCSTQVSAYWALELLASEYTRAMTKLEAGRKNLAEAKEKGLSLLAARKVEKAWRETSWHLTFLAHRQLP